MCEMHTEALILLGRVASSSTSRNNTKDLKLAQKIQALENGDTFFFLFSLPLCGKQVHYGVQAFLMDEHYLLHNLQFPLIIYAIYLAAEMVLYIIGHLSILKLRLCLQKYMDFIPITCYQTKIPVKIKYPDFA